MIGIILAAGEGIRLGNITKDTPKTLLTIDGETLLYRLCRQMSSIGITHIVLVVGFQAEKIETEAILISKEFGITFSYIINEHLDRGNAYSFKLLKPWFKAYDEDYLLVESDIIVDEDFFGGFEFGVDPIASGAEFQIGMNGSFIIDNEVKLSKDFRVDLKSASLKTMNVYYIPDDIAKYLSAKMGKTGGYYEKYFGDIQFEVYKYEGKWFEIDTKSDLSHAKVLFGSASEKFTELSNRFGGYERYDFDNFLLPTNDFGSGKLYDMILDPELIKNYPSSMQYIQDLASKITNINPKNILVGNGLSEFINILSKQDHTYDYHLPIFGEFKKFTLNERSTRKIIVNPNNPDGRSYTREEIIQLLDNGYHILLDESFIDFGGESLLDNETLEKYPALTIIKSYSKYLGVPGLRLGMMFSSNPTQIEFMKKQLPIWGVNSIAERFLEVLPLFEHEVKTSLRQISIEHKRLSGELTRFGEVSGAGNFIMIKTPHSSREICERLIDRGILIKDLYDNVGYNAIRLNIKDKVTNGKLTNAMREVYAKLERNME